MKVTLVIATAVIGADAWFWKKLASSEPKWLLEPNAQSTWLGGEEAAIQVPAPFFDAIDEVKCDLKTYTWWPRVLKTFELYSTTIEVPDIAYTGRVTVSCSDGSKNIASKPFYFYQTGPLAVAFKGMKVSALVSDAPDTVDVKIEGALPKYSYFAVMVSKITKKQAGKMTQVVDSSVELTLPGDAKNVLLELYAKPEGRFAFMRPMKPVYRAAVDVVPELIYDDSSFEDNFDAVDANSLNAQIVDGEDSEDEVSSPEIPSSSMGSLTDDGIDDIQSMSPLNEPKHSVDFDAIKKNIEGVPREDAYAFIKNYIRLAEHFDYYPQEEIDKLHELLRLYKSVPEKKQINLVDGGFLPISAKPNQKNKRPKGARKVNKIQKEQF